VPVYAWPNVTTIDVTVKNDSTGPCNEFFWTDLYVYTDTVAPVLQDKGVAWKGISSLGPNASTSIEFTHVFTDSGTYYVYAQADSFGFVTEQPPDGESNNVSEPLTLTVLFGSPTPTATATAAQDPDCGWIDGTVWTFIGGQVVLRSERVNMTLKKGTQLLQEELSETYGSYAFECVSAGTGYEVWGLVEIDGVTYQGYQLGIQVVQEQGTSPVDVILYPL
jgi:hypothetical protein